MANGYESGVNKGSISDILQLLEGFSSGHERQRDRIGLSQANLSQLITSAQTPGQIANAKKALKNISGDSSQYADTSITYQTLSNVLENKNTAYKYFEDGLNSAVKYIENPEFLDSEEEFMDLKGMANLVVEDDSGQLVGRYESVGSMLREKFSNVNSLIAQINSGSQYGFKKDKIPGIAQGKSYSQQELLTTLETQQDRLKTAMQAALINGEINEEEAAMIMSGATPEAYENQKNRIINENEGFIKANLGGIFKTDALLQKLKREDMLSEDDYSVLDSFVGELNGEQMTGRTMYSQEGGIDEVIKLLEGQKISLNKDLQNRYKRHEYWAGMPYAGGPEGTERGEKAEQAFISSITGEKVEKPDYFSSKKYDTIVRQKQQDIKEKREEEAIFEDIDKDIEDASNEDLMKRYGTINPQEIKSKLETEIKSQREKELLWLKKKPSERAVLDDDLSTRSVIDTTFKGNIKPLESKGEIPDDFPLEFQEIITSDLENSEAKAIKHYKLDGFKSSLGSVLNKDGSRLDVEDLAYMNPTKLRSKLIKLKQDRKLKGPPTKEQNDLIKSITKDIAQIDKLHKMAMYPKKAKGKGKEPEEITFVKKRLMESYNKLMDSIMSNLNEKHISKVKNKYTK